MLLLLSLACDGGEMLTMVSDNAPGRGDTASFWTPADTADSADSGDSAEDSGDSGEDTGVDPNLPSWTVLVFVNGDNDLERWALADMNEMEAVGSTDEVNVIVQMDRSGSEAAGDGDWSGARRFHVEADADVHHIGSPVLADLGDVDSGVPETVLDFVEWGVATWPAQHYALVLWDHGDGWSFAPEPPTTKGISYDDTSGTVMSVARGDVTEVVHGAAKAIGRKLDVIGFDACTMAQWEVATTVADDAHYMVASQDYEDVAGWPYDEVLTDLVTYPDIDGAVFGSSVALRFHEIPDSTMSVVDLSALPNLTASLDTLADSIVASGTAAELLAAAAPGAQGYDGSHSREHDLVDFVTRVGLATGDPDVKSAADAVITAADAAVLTSYNEGGIVAESHGLSIFSPEDGAMPPLYQNAPWSKAGTWDEMVVAASGK